MQDTAKPDILLLKPVAPHLMAELERTSTLHKLHEAADANGLMATLGPHVRGVAGGGMRIDAAFFDRFPRLEIVSNFGVGYDAVDAREAARRDIMVTNTPDVLNDEVADLALGLLLATIRQIPQTDRYLRAGHWPKGDYPLTATLRGRTVGILGLGRIGRAIARRLEGFDVAIAYHGRRKQDDVAYAYYDDLVAMARAVDVLVVVAPASEATRGIVGAAVLEALGPRGILINVARGSLVDEPALIDALTSGTIHGAGLDVFASEPHVPAALVALDHVVLLPHVGSASTHTRERMGALMVENLTSWFAGRGPVTPVAETPWRTR